MDMEFEIFWSFLIQDETVCRFLPKSSIYAENLRLKLA